MYLPTFVINVPAYLCHQRSCLPLLLFVINLHMSSQIHKVVSVPTYLYHQRTYLYNQCTCLPLSSTYFCLLFGYYFIHFLPVTDPWHFQWHHRSNPRQDEAQPNGNVEQYSTSWCTIKVTENPPGWSTGQRNRDSSIHIERACSSAGTTQNQVSFYLPDGLTSAD